MQATLDFNHQVFDEDRRIVEQQWPEDLPNEVHIRADESSIAYRKTLAGPSLGRAYAA